MCSILFFAFACQWGKLRFLAAQGAAGSGPLPPALRRDVLAVEPDALEADALDAVVLVEALDVRRRQGRREDVDVAEDDVAHPPPVLGSGLGVLRDVPDDDRGEGRLLAGIPGVEVLRRGGKDSRGRGGVVRSSTRPVYSAEAIVQAGMDFIRGNFAKGITVTSVVRAMRVSRRLAELRFRQVRGTTIGASIAEARIRHAQKLLKTTQMSLDEIAADCGISGANYLARVFRRHVGLSPRAWARARG